MQIYAQLIVCANILKKIFRKGKKPNPIYPFFYFTDHPNAFSRLQPFTPLNPARTILNGVYHGYSLTNLNSSLRSSLLTDGACRPELTLPNTKKKKMKKTFLGAALLLFIGAAHVSAAGRTPQMGQPAIVHNILSSQLPTALLMDIKTDYKDYWITELSEEGKGKHPDYSLTLENADQVIQLHSSDSKIWVVISTSIKAN